MSESMSLKETEESTAGAAAECSHEGTGSEQQSCSSGDRSDAEAMKQPCAFFMRTGTCAYVSPWVAYVNARVRGSFLCEA
jgi:hypothetical protein